jgi:hypothetical protein
MSAWKRLKLTDTSHRSDGSKFFLEFAPLRHWCNVTRYLVGGVTVRVRAHRPCFGGLVRAISAFKWECGVLLLGPLARLMGLRASGTFPCLYASHFRDFPASTALPQRTSHRHPSVASPDTHRRFNFNLRCVSGEATERLGRAWGGRLSPETSLFAESGLIRDHLAAG